MDLLLGTCPEDKKKTPSSWEIILTLLQYKKDRAYLLLFSLFSPCDYLEPPILPPSFLPPPSLIPSTFAMDKEEVLHEKIEAKRDDIEGHIELSEEDNSPIEEVRVTVPSEYHHPIFYT
jgi:hypothetical protein